MNIAQARSLLEEETARVAKAWAGPREDMICPRCGSILSAVNGECVRGKYCKPISAPPQAEEGGSLRTIPETDPPSTFPVMRQA